VLGTGTRPTMARRVAAGVSKARDRLVAGPFWIYVR